MKVTGCCKYSLSQAFFRIRVFKNFSKFIGKYLYWSLFFDKVAGLQSTSGVGVKWLSHYRFFLYLPSKPTIFAIPVKSEEFVNQEVENVRNFFLDLTLSVSLFYHMIRFR